MEFVLYTSSCYLSMFFCLIKLTLTENLNCNTTVQIDHVVYKGCTESIPTDSLITANADFKLINSFKGIPYAEAPIHKLRFKKPQPKTYANKVVINATKFGKSCLQPPVIDWDDNPLNFADSSENCLFINIFTATLNSTALLPVLFYIHGGFFRTDSSRDFPGEWLALRDVVVVTINYRLGVFGFLCADTPDAPGNQALWDQALALDWTNHNIEYFGGNPNDVTIVGQSVGSTSVSTHVVSDISRHLFKNAILMSGSALEVMTDIKTCVQTAQQYADYLGCKGLDIDCLRNKTGYELLIAQIETDVPLQPIFLECFGDKFLPKPVKQLINEQNFNQNIHILSGHTTHEGSRFYEIIDAQVFTYGRYDPGVPDSIIDVRIARKDLQNFLLKPLNTSSTEQISGEYTKTFENSSFASNLTERNRLRNVVMHCLSDFTQTCNTVLFGFYLVEQAKFAGQVFQYYLSYANSKSACYNSNWCNATHGDDYPLVFGYPFYKQGYSDADRNMSVVMMDIWTKFVKSGGVPIIKGNVWPSYSRDTNGEPIVNYMQLDSNRFSVYRDKYKGNNGFKPNVIQNCINYWRYQT